jgi:hypothetical protein
MLTNPAVDLDDDFQGGMLLLAIALVIKGVLTLMTASRLRKQAAPTVPDGNAPFENSWDGWP